MKNTLKLACALLMVPLGTAVAQETAPAAPPAQAPAPAASPATAAPPAEAAPAAAATPAAPAEPAPEAAAPTAPAESAPAPAAVAPAPVIAPAPEPVAVVETTTIVAEEPVAEETEEEGSWSDDLSISLFADAYYNVDWNLSNVNPDSGYLNLNGTQGHRAYVRTNGFALSFLGFEASYMKEKYGFTGSLRFGPSANPLIGQLGGGLGLDFVKQAFVSLMPTESLTIDFGQFDTIYGAEVADSWANVNYTRGALYFLMQPFWHTGLRVAYQASDLVALKFLVVNGVNQPFDSDRAVDLGAQLVLTPSEEFAAYIGYYGAQAKPDGQTWSHFFDLVATADLDPVLLVFNADLGINDFAGVDESTTYWGLSLAARLALASEWGLGLRGEYLSETGSDAASEIIADLASSEDGSPSATDFFDDYLATVTLTLEYIPSCMDGNVIFRLDNRLETSGVDLFYEGADSVVGGQAVANTGTFVSSVLGVVVKTN